MSREIASGVLLYQSYRYNCHRTYMFPLEFTPKWKILSDVNRYQFQQKFMETEGPIKKSKSFYGTYKEELYWPRIILPSTSGKLVNCVA